VEISLPTFFGRIKKVGRRRQNKKNGSLLIVMTPNAKVYRTCLQPYLKTFNGYSLESDTGLIFGKAERQKVTDL
jgi:hypothetical protein